MTQPFTYRVRFIPTGEYYYGVRYAKNCNPSDLWTKYFTSSKKVKNLIKKYGKDSFEYEIRKIFNTSEDAILWEHRVNSRTKIWPNYLNESDAKHQGSKYSSTGGLISKEKGIGVHNPERPWKNDLVKSSNQKNGNKKGGAKTGARPWWNNGIKDTKSIECPGDGWVRGMIQKGYYWNNGTEQRVCSASPGTGWVRGGLTKTVNGRRWWNNGTIQSLTIDSPGSEWKPGLLAGNMGWWTNGISQQRKKDCPGPEWTKGMLKK